MLERLRHPGSALKLWQRTARLRRQILRSADAEMLLNLVRLRYNARLCSSSSVTSSRSTATTPRSMLRVRSVRAASQRSAPGGRVCEHPTVTYTPLAGEEFATRMLTAIPLDSVMLFEQNGWRAERLLLVVVQRVNDLLNAPTASGPTPEREPYYAPFADFAERMERLRSAGLMGFNWETKEHETDPLGRNPRFWLNPPADPNSPLAADVAAVRHDLGLATGKNDFSVTAFPVMRTPDEVGVRCRSLLGVMYFLSKAVEPPEPHVEAGLVAVTMGDDGQPFDWSKVTGRVMTIHSQADRPRKAFVAVQHRGWWFYIADDDQSSKATFGLLNILYSLQQATGKGKSPVLTLPVSR